MVIDFIPFIIFFFVFYFGSMLGSFANAVIYRMPRNISIVFPRSSCPNCNYIIKWYSNIPLFSYLVQKGKCKNCGYSIGLGYFNVELLCGIVSVAIWSEYSNIYNYIFYLWVFIALLVIFLIDIEHHIIPDKINLYLFVLFLVYAVINFSYFHYLSGFLIGFGATYLITWIFYKVKGVVGLGGGDIKLFGVLGVYLGPEIFYTIFFSSFLGSIITLILISTGKFSKDNPFAFGPYIVVTAIFQIYFSDFFDRINILAF